MNRRFILPFVCVALAVATLFLWMQIESLNDRVDSLTQQLKVRPKTVVLPVDQTGRLDEDTDEDRIFRLIETKQNGETDVGVPWSVERAMIGEGRQRSLRDAPLRESSPSVIEVTPESVPPGAKNWLDSIPASPSAED